MRSKSLTASIAAVLLCFTARADSPPPQRFLGSQTCSTSGCHGSARTGRDQSFTWMKKDFHSRSYATLTTARSQRIADALGIGNPAQSERCAVCHAPLQTVPVTNRAPTVAVTEGVSCETCHGAGEFWLRAHTRPDYTHADRVTAGLRDLNDLYLRANTCVACHQTVDVDLLQAGHPALIFELDGQCVSEPKHWRENKDWSGAQAWLVGQAVALREISAQLSRETAPDKALATRWSGLLWVLQQADVHDARLPSLQSVKPEPAAGNAAQAMASADLLAQQASAIEWPAALSRNLLAELAASGAAFNDATVPQEIQARRAERLVLALDRLVDSLDTDPSIAALRPELGRLFSLVQSVPDFDPQQFARESERFASQLKKSPGNG